MGLIVLGVGDSREQHPCVLLGTGQGLGTLVPKGAGTDTCWDGATVTSPRG